MEDGLKKIDTTKYSNPEFFNWMMNTIDIWDGRYQNALDRLSQAQEVPETSMRCAYYTLQQAEVYRYLNNTNLARWYYESVRKFLENKVRELPDVAEYHSLLGLAYAGLGEKEKAIELGKLGTAMLPVTRDAVSGPIRLEELARIYVMVGKHKETIDTLKNLLDMPSRLSHKLIAIDPVWDPLHNYPSFQKLIKPDKFPANQ